MPAVLWRQARGLGQAGSALAFRLGLLRFLAIWALSVDVRISLPTRCSIINSWNTTGEALKALSNGA
jgi:hypothetical protein